MIAARTGIAVLAPIACLFGAGCEQAPIPAAAPGSAPAPASAPGIGAAAATAPPWFREEAAQRGLRFIHDSGAAATRRWFMPETMVGGAALFDADGDGDLDAYLVQARSLLDPPEKGQGNRLFRNRGDGTFEDVTEGSGAGHRGYGAGVATGDYDNDGDVDLYVTNVGPNVLLANDGSGRFTDVTSSAGVGDAGWGASAAFFDYDRDGDLDLFVCNYLLWSVRTNVECPARFVEGLDYCSPKAINRPAVAVLYRNEGDGRFTDVSAAAGIGDIRGTGLGVVCGDFDGDGWPDVFVANDGWPNRLWHNRGDGTFQDIAMATGCAIDEDGSPKAGMGVDATDLDDDGDLDLIVCNLNAETDSVFVNQGGWFQYATPRLGLAPLSRRFTRFGMSWCDFDNDGRLDLYQANGRVAMQETAWSADPYAEPNLLYRGLADGRFSEVLPRGGTAEVLVATSRAAAFGDVDNDGGIDVLVVNRDGPAHLLMNAVNGRGHWIMLQVLDDHGRDALGATVSMRVGSGAGARTIRRDVRTAYSYQAANDPRVHVGLGDVAVAHDVTVTWPDGSIEGFGDLDADQFVSLRRGAGR